MRSAQLVKCSVSSFREWCECVCARAGGGGGEGEGMCDVWSPQGH